MKRDKEWLKEKVEEIYTHYSISNNFDFVSKREAITEISNLINQLDEPEQTDTNVGLSKQVIPIFVADWIKRQMKFGYEDVFTSMTRLRWSAPEKVRFWFDNNPDTYARAWMGGYEVEKEKKYRVVLPFTVWDEDTSELNETTMFLAFDITSGETRFSRPFPSAGKNGDYRTYLTESQIKAIDERYWAFAEEVTE